MKDKEFVDDIDDIEDDDIDEDELDDDENEEEEKEPLDKSGSKLMRRAKALTSRQLYRWLGAAVGVNYLIVQDIFTKLPEAVAIAMEEGYTINIPRIGAFVPIYKQGIRVGDKYYYPKSPLIKNGRLSEEEARERLDRVGKDLVEENDKYYIVSRIDTQDYYVPSFQFKKKYKDEVKERTKRWQK